MTLRIIRKPSFRLFAVLVALVTCAVLVSAPNSPFTEHDKAYYADPNLVNFVRPGLQFQILSAEIAADGTIRVRVKATDPRGLGLDRLGVTTPGTVGMSFIAATIPAGETLYTSYTTRRQTSPITNQTATQAGADTGGTWQVVGDGEYIYTFGTKAPANIDRNALHSISVYGSRNLSEFDLPTNYDDDTFHFIPAGGAVRPGMVRDIIKTATCNKCHDQLGLHGGSRRSMENCVLCHQPQTTDPDTGNTVDMATMIHKIHRGKDLPSVVAGGKYVIVGNAQAVHDYSKIGFSAYGGVANCMSCHEQGKGAAQENAWLTPSRRACGSCHDNVNFASGQGHATGLPQVSDNQCSNCHTPEGELEFDASVKGAHTVPIFSRDLPGLVFEINGVTNTAPGQQPTVTFTLKDREGRGLSMVDVPRLALVLAGPTSDYTTYVSEDPRTRATGGQDGRFTYTFTAAIPQTAKGTFTIGIEGYRSLTLLAGTQKEMTVRDAGINKTLNFTVDGSQLAARRQVVSLAKCNTCHSFLSLHGNNRNTIDQCVLCHNPKETDNAVRPVTERPAESIEFSVMIHRIHAGHEQTREYTVYGRGSSKNTYNDVGFPGRLQNCEMCHVNNSQQLPLASTETITDPRGLINPALRTTAACTGCHTSVAAASHALANTTVLGESCAACHGPNADFSVNRAHAQ